MDVHLLDRYAFNLDRRAYDRRLPPPMASGLNLHSAKLKVLKPASQAFDRTCPPVQPSQAELNGIGPRPSHECVWVGMQPSAAIMATLTGPDSTDDNSAKLFRGSIASLEEEHLSIVAYDPQALRVVAKVAGESVRFFVLANPSNATSLCEGHHVAVENIFLFRTFLDEREPSKKGRRSACLDKIRNFVRASKSGPDREAVSAGGFNEESAVIDGDVQEAAGEGEKQVMQTASSGYEALIDPRLFQPPPQADGLVQLAPAQTLNTGSALPSPTSPAALEQFRKSVIPGPPKGIFSPPRTVATRPAPIQKALVPQHGATQTIEKKKPDSAVDDAEPVRKRARIQLPANVDPPQTQKVEVSRISTAATRQKPASDLITNLITLGERLEEHGALSVLHQCTDLFEDLEKDQYTESASLLTAALRVPYGEITGELCNSLHDNFERLFPNVVEETKISPGEFNLLLRGLQTQGMYTLEYEMIGPYVMAFCIELHSHFGDGPLPAKIKKYELDQITTRARGHARALVNPVRRTRLGGNGEVLTSIEMDGN